jgi:hypothetical protein
MPMFCFSGHSLTFNLLKRAIWVFSVSGLFPAAVCECGWSLFRTALRLVACGKLRLTLYSSVLGLPNRSQELLIDRLHLCTHTPVNGSFLSFAHSLLLLSLQTCPSQSTLFLA